MHERKSNMAISWISALKMVPWDVVVSNAPSVVDGARKLWKSAGRNEAVTGEVQTDMSTGSRLEALEREVADLQQEMTSSAELIKALADQNAQLVQAIAALRSRQRLIGLALALASAVAVVGLVLHFTR
jgi:hypothetical protein